MSNRGASRREQIATVLRTEHPETAYAMADAITLLDARKDGEIAGVPLELTPQEATRIEMALARLFRDGAETPFTEMVAQLRPLFLSCRPNPAEGWLPIPIRRSAEPSEPHDGRWVEISDGQATARAYWGLGDNGWSQSGYWMWIMAPSDMDPTHWRPTDQATARRTSAS